MKEHLPALLLSPSALGVAEAAGPAPCGSCDESRHRIVAHAPQMARTSTRAGRRHDRAALAARNGDLSCSDAALRRLELKGRRVWRLHALLMAAIMSTPTYRRAVAVVADFRPRCLGRRADARAASVNPQSVTILVGRRRVEAKEKISVRRRDVCGVNNRVDAMPAPSRPARSEG